jgi:hypothetical protein
MGKLADFLAFLMGLAPSETAFDGVCRGRNIHKNIHGIGNQGCPFGSVSAPEEEANKNTPRLNVNGPIAAQECARGSHGPSLRPRRGRGFLPPQRVASGMARDSLYRDIERGLQEKVDGDLFERR